MKYKKLMEKIFRQLAEYKNIIDNLSILYQAEKDQFEEELNQMQDKYTQEYISKLRKDWKPSRNYADEIKKARTKHQSAATKYFYEMEKEVDTYFQIPVDSGFSSTIMAIKNLEIVPNNKEIELLQGAAKGYWNQRILHEIGVSRAREGQRVAIENGEPKVIEGNVKIPYATKLPDIQGIYDALQDVKNSITIGFESYCGIGYALKDIVFPPSRTDERTDELLEKEYGLQTGLSKPDALAISKMASSARCFNESYPSYTEFLEAMEDLVATMPEEQKKTTLTDADKELMRVVGS